MATSLSNRNADRMYKYESIRVELIKYFVGNYPSLAETVKDYFYNFHRTHQLFRFSITQIFDGTTHVLVDVNGYTTIREELERKTKTGGSGLVEVSNLSPPLKVLYQKAFPSHQAYRDCLNKLRMQNETLYAKQKEDARLHARKLKSSISGRLRDSTFLAFDTELYEHDRETLLEIGFVEFTLKDDDSPTYFHYIITDNEHIKNGDNVPDNRDKFQFGTSERISLREAAAQFRQHIEGADVLVVHGGKADTKILDQLDIQIPAKEILDTQVLALALLSTGPRMPRHWGLKRMMGELGIACDETILHNGGNDAAYTMKAFRTLASKAKTCYL